MTMTDGDLEQRLRRDLAELGGFPSDEVRERRDPRPVRPILSIAAALVVVLALITTSIAIVKSVSDRSTTPPVSALPRVHTILEQPPSVTGSSSSVIAKPLTQVCEQWRDLPTGVDCRHLQARYVWSSLTAKRPHVTYSVIEVVGRPDKKLDLDGTVKSAYPVWGTVPVHGYTARIYGNDKAMAVAWHEGPDLQITVRISGDEVVTFDPGTLRYLTINFARRTYRVPIDPLKSTYVVRSGANPLEYKQTFDPGPWTLTWRPTDRRLCTSAESMDKCFTVGVGVKNVRAQGVLLEGCVNVWVGTQGVIFGSAPEITRRIAIDFTNTDGVRSHSTQPVFIAPYEPHVRLFAVALRHPDWASATAVDAHGHQPPVGSVVIEHFRNAC